MSSPSPAPLGADPRPSPRGRRKFTVDALFTDHRPQAVGVEDLPTAKEIRLERIEADPEQPRRTFDPDRLAELTASVRREGILQPIAVRYDGDRDVYVVIHGERRLRAARDAGLAAIPAIVRDVPHDRRLVQQLMENIVRDDLNAVERAAALRALKVQLDDAPWDTVAEMVGIRRSRLFQLLGTEKLPDVVRDDIRTGKLSEKQSRALQGLPEGQQIALRDAIVEQNLSTESASRLARALKRSGLEDGRETAAAFIAAQRAEHDNDTAAVDPLSQAAGLFAAIEAAASGERGAAAALESAAKMAKAARFDGDRLRGEVLALARTLARTPADELVPGGEAYMPLSMLRAALDVLMPAE
jgi:ParB family chromosome partitioning protein